jgi:hypothetical protein
VGRGSLTNLGLSAAGRARLARELAEAHERVDHLPESVRFLRIAIEAGAAAARPGLQRRLDSLRTEIDRRATNAARQPQIGESLDQPRLVRPRIPPRALAPATTPGAGR